MPLEEPVQTTAPRAPKKDEGPLHEVPSWGLVVLWSKKEPHRRGAVALLKPFEETLFGRAFPGTKGLSFAPQRPGLPLAPPGLAGDSLSRKELVLVATAVGIEMEHVGRWPVLVNAEVRTSAVLEVNHVLRFEGELVLLVVRRPLVLDAEDIADTHVFGEPDEDGIVGESEAIAKLRRAIRKAAKTKDHVLARGESGSGKELVAHAIHRHSPRANAIFLPVNGAGFSLELIDVEVFGNLKGFPNPGMEARKGILPSANGGTVFFDEIGDVDIKVQVRLLRALDKGEFRTLGEAMPRRTDLRMVGAGS